MLESEIQRLWWGDCTLARSSSMAEGTTVLVGAT